MSRIFILGGTTVFVDGEKYRFKKSVSDYVKKLSSNFDEVTWMVPLEYGGESKKSGTIDQENVEVVTYSAEKRSFPLSWYKFIKYSFFSDVSILFLPPLLIFFPLVSILKKLNKKVIVYVANDYTEKIEKSDKGKFLAWIYRKAHEYPMSKADVTIARGKKMESIAKRVSKRVVKTYPMGNMKLTENRRGKNSDKKYTKKSVLYVGILKESKGIKNLIKSFGKVEGSLDDENISLEIVGDGEKKYVRRLKKVSDKFVEGEVNFHGWVSDRERLSNFYESSTVLAVPTTTHPETVPRVIDEAILRRTPVIATKVGGVASEFQEGEVVLVEPGDVDGLAQAIHSLISDQKLRKSILKKAEARAELLEEYNNAADQHVDIIKSVIDQS